MKFMKIAKYLALFSIILLQFVFVPVPKAHAATTRVSLGTVEDFAVLAGSAIADSTPSVVTGDVGLSPTTGAAIDLTCPEVFGNIYTVAAAGPLPCRIADSGRLTTAKNDLTTAYNNAAARGVTSAIGTELGGSTLTDGVYDSAAGTFGITGTLTLNGQGNANSVFIFKMASTLITASSSRVLLTNGAQSCNVFWQVGSSATLGTSSTFIGNIMADQSITDNGGSTVDGRLLASVAAVTLDNTHVTKSTCAAGTIGGSPTLASSSSTSTGGSTAYCPVLNSQIVPPLIVQSRRVDSDSISISWGPYSGVNTFVVQYGTVNGNWTYSTLVTGFSTTINNLPLNQPIWVRVAATDNCTVGVYGASRLVGGPMLPNTGLATRENSFPLDISAIIIMLASTTLLLLQRRYKTSNEIR